MHFTLLEHLVKSAILHRVPHNLNHILSIPFSHQENNCDLQDSGLGATLVSCTLTLDQDVAKKQVHAWAPSVCFWPHIKLLMQVEGQLRNPTQAARCWWSNLPDLSCQIWSFYSTILILQIMRHDWLLADGLNLSKAGKQVTICNRNIACSCFESMYVWMDAKCSRLFVRISQQSQIKPIQVPASFTTILTACGEDLNHKKVLPITMHSVTVSSNLWSTHLCCALQCCT